MQVERLGTNKVRIFISYDDLDERDIDRDEIWQNGRKVQELFWDMMERAYLEVGFEVMGPIAVEAFTMPTEGVVVIVTQVPSLPEDADKEKDELEDADQIITVEPFTAFTFMFDDIENVISAAHVIHSSFDTKASLFSYKNKYFLHFGEENLEQEETDALWSILQEYGSLTNVSNHVLEEYGNLIIKDNAVETLVEHFGA